MSGMYRGPSVKLWPARVLVDDVAIGPAVWTWSQMRRPRYVGSLWSKLITQIVNLPETKLESPRQHPSFGGLQRDFSGADLSSSPLYGSWLPRIRVPGGSRRSSQQRCYWICCIGG